MLLTKLLNRLRVKKTKQLKNKLSLVQKDNTIFINGTFSNTNYIIKGLWFVSRNENQTIKLNSEQASSEFQFEINLLNNDKFIRGVSDIFDLFLYVSVAKKDLPKNKYKELQNIMDPRF
ncbi:hypothetical protein [Pueribacillus sp. YX66]|uniref:hypothetical protein n=1 Tax=Pueribacillus sp. YX66 TaxID=3229242 RepID=UPI00358CEA8F